MGDHGFSLRSECSPLTVDQCDVLELAGEAVGVTRLRKTRPRSHGDRAVTTETAYLAVMDKRRPAAQRCQVGHMGALG